MATKKHSPARTAGNPTNEGVAVRRRVEQSTGLTAQATSLAEARWGVEHLEYIDSRLYQASAMISILAYTFTEVDEDLRPEFEDVFQVVDCLAYMLDLAHAASKPACESYDGMPLLRAHKCAKVLDALLWSDLSDRTMSINQEVVVDYLGGMAVFVDQAKQANQVGWTAKARELAHA